MSQRGKRGQVSIFIIIALLIAAGIGGYFLISSQLGSEAENGEFGEVFTYYSTCIEQYAATGLSVASVQGGRIDSGVYNPGSDYYPFGNQLVVSGASVPYWMSVQGNGVLEENVPTQAEIEQELAEYVEGRIPDCSFDIYREQGLDISVGQPQVNAQIATNGVLVNIQSQMSVSNGNSSATRNSFSVQVPSRFGELFTEAKEIYAEEQKNLFLENYSFDVLRLYAPVDGVEIQCAPKTWVARTVLSDLKTALSANLQSLRFNSGNDEYFDIDLPIDNSAQVIYDSRWPSRFEVYGNDGEILQADPIGNQQGLAAMGFCYVPYHFVYDMFFPVVIRVNSDDGEFFQFPVVVMIDKNTPREPSDYLIESADTEGTEDLCSFATQDIDVSVRSSSGGSVRNATVAYTCFDQRCAIGTTDSSGRVSGRIPACINGAIEVDADGFMQDSFTFSSNNASTAEVFVDKAYDVELQLLVDGRASSAQTFISFEGDHGIVQGVIPESRTVKLSAGFYNLSVYQYGNASIRIPASSTRQCTTVSKGGLAGIFGGTEEQCFNIEIPETIIDKALTAGGQGEIYLPEELLEDRELTVSVSSLPKPTGIDSLETNYALFDTQGADIIYD